MLWLNIIIFLISCYLLVHSGIWVVKALTRIARFLGWKEFIVASVLMAFSTSLPEIFVGMTSALSQKPQLALGVVVGSNLVDLTLIIGVGALFAKGMTLKRKIFSKSAIYASAYSILPLLLMLDGKVSRADGIILLVSLAFYFSQILSQEERFTRKFNQNNHKGWKGFKIFLKSLAGFWIGTGLLLLSAEGIVYSASKLAENFNISLVIIGVLLVAFGTSLPELAFEIRAIRSGHKKMSLGDATGSVVINSSLVLGLVALAAPFEITNFSPYLIGIIFTLATSFFFLIFAKTDRKITRKEGVFLIAIYVIFVVVELLINKGNSLTLGS